MSDITSLQSSIYSPMLVDELNTLPELFFNDAATEIGAAVNTIGESIELRMALTNLDTENKARVIAEQVLNAYDGLKQCPEHRACFLPLSKLSSQIGAEITNVFTILRNNVRPEVDMLLEAINQKMQEYVTDENKEIAINPEAKTNTAQMLVLDWDQMFSTFGGEEILADTYKDLTKLDGTRGIVDLRELLAMGVLTQNPIQLVDSAAQEVQGRILDALKSSDVETQEAVKAVYNLITDPYDYSALVAHTLGELVRSNDYASAVTKIKDSLFYLRGVLQVYKVTPQNLSDTVNAQFVNNIQNVENLLYMMGYALVILRDHYKDALIIDYKLLNGDQFQAYEENGGSMDDVVKFIHTLYEKPGIPIPMDGIDADKVKSVKNEVDEKYDSLLSSYTLQAASIKYNATVKAARDILNLYIQDTDESRLPEGVSAESFWRMKRPLVNNILNRYDTDEDSNLEVLLYDFVISMWYDGTMVRTVHEMFGREVIKQLEASQDIDNETVALMDATVASSVVAQFLMNSICCVK